MFRHQFTINPSINLIPLIQDTNIGLVEVIKNNLSHDEIQLLFIESCKKGSLLIAEELLKFDSTIYVHTLLAQPRFAQLTTFAPPVFHSINLSERANVVS